MNYKEYLDDLGKRFDREAFFNSKRWAIGDNFFKQTCWNIFGNIFKYYTLKKKSPFL